MDLLSIVQALWRHKLVTIPVILLTVLGAFYVLKVKRPVYDASSSILLVGPPGPPTAGQIAADPKLRNVDANNPYVDYGALSVIADSVIEVVTSGAAQPALVKAGVDPQYQLALSTDYGNPPIIDITGVGPSAQQAIHSANVLTQAAKTNLYQLQQKEGVNSLYMITAISIVRPTQAQLSSSGKLRSLVAVLALGMVLLFVVVSVIDVIDKRRRSDPISPDRPPSDHGRRSRTRERVRGGPRIDGAPIRQPTD